MFKSNAYGMRSARVACGLDVNSEFLDFAA